MLRAPGTVTLQTWVDRALEVAVTAGVSVLILVGFATSYRTLLDLAATVGAYPHWLAPAVPLSFDLGVIVLSLKVAQAAREGRHAPVLRALVVVLSGVTVMVNASAATGLPARLLHGVPPAMFVICFESVIVTLRRHALQERGVWQEPVLRQHPLRWVLAPRSTWTRWRNAVLASPEIDTDGAAKAQKVVVDRGRASASQLVTAAAGGSPARLRVVVAALQRDRQLSAAVLRTMLSGHGFDVSLRTVQRLRAVALEELRGASDALLRDHATQAMVGLRDEQHDGGSLESP